jgi:hypothetical protein
MGKIFLISIFMLTLIFLLASSCITVVYPEAGSTSTSNPASTPTQTPNQSSNTKLNAKVWVDNVKHPVGQPVHIRFSIDKAAYLTLSVTPPDTHTQTLFTNVNYLAGTYDYPVTASQSGTWYLSLGYATDLKLQGEWGGEMTSFNVVSQ